MHFQIINNIRIIFRIMGSNFTHQQTLDIVNRSLFAIGLMGAVGGTLEGLEAAAPVFRQNVGPLVGTFALNASFPGRISVFFGGVFGVGTAGRMLTGPEAAALVHPTVASEVPVSLENLDQLVREGFEQDFREENPHLVEEDRDEVGVPDRQVVEPAKRVSLHEDVPDNGDVLRELFREEEKTSPSDATEGVENPTEPGQSTSEGVENPTEPGQSTFEGSKPEKNKKI